MKLNGLFKISALAAALVLSACGGDINISEGNVDNSTVINNPAPPTTPTIPVTVNALITAGIATDVSAEFPAITDKPVYRLAANTTFTTDAVLTSDAHWVLTGRTAVGGDNVDSATLEIEAGTTIFGEAGEDFLVVRRGSQIDARGTAALPIIMTSVQDVTGEETAIGQWGGLVLLGNAPANSCGDQTGEATAEELAGCGVSAEGDAGQFGGNDSADNSGTIRYVVVKHAGNSLGNGDELNGITFAGVGSQTTVEYIQVHQNLDDGIEFFGGSVNVKNVVLTDIGDDSLDWSFGWTGTAQFVYIQQNSAAGDNAIEADNSEFDASATPLTKPAISNVTIVGADATNGIRLRAGTAGNLTNVLVTGPTGYSNCLRVNGNEAAANAASGLLTMTSSVVACADPNDNFNDQVIGSGTTQSWFMGQDGNMTLTPNDLGLAVDGYTPLAGSVLLSGVNPRNVRTSFDDARYIGAFNGQTNWMSGWTVGVNGGFPADIQNAFEQGLATDVSAQYPAIIDKPVYSVDEDSVFTAGVTFTNNAHWIIKGRTAVGGDNQDSAVLYIEDGTTIIGESGEDFLVARRGSRIEALGTAASPIIMTSIQDVTGEETDIGQWGGLVLLGNAPANSCGDQQGETTADELANCGVSAEGDAGQFGGNNPQDNSGTLNYVVVKYAGNSLGNGDELNGITFAGVGSGTKVDYIQVHKNLDDGIEFFGGTVSVRHVVLTDNGDDSFDWSFGWTGNAQFVYIVQNSAAGDNAFEADNSEFDAAATPLTNPTVANVTIQGAAATNGVRLRAGTAGTLKNFVVVGPADYSNCLRINGTESEANATAGTLSITHSFLACEGTGNFGNNTFTQDLFIAETTNRIIDSASALNLASNGRTPEATSPLLGAGADLSVDNEFFVATSYVGAFDVQSDWTNGWTFGLNNGIPTNVQNAFEQNLVTDASALFPAITDKPVYQFTANTTFTADVTLTNDAHWVLNGRTAVGGDNENAAILYIEAGTTVFGQEGEDFLVARRGSKIEALGTAEAPITMTSVQDVTGQETAAGQWGGLVLLGRAPANSCGDQQGETTADELANCGVSAEGDAGQFGGNMANDDSGTLRYVIVKHAGRTLGNGDELNGITFAGVGSGTVVDYIHVHQNLDDGVEFFGGTVSVKHVVLTDIGDDAFDWSFGWVGNAQFILVKQGDGDNAFEADNSEFDAAATPLTNPNVANVTIIGSNGSNGVRLRAGTAGSLWNFSITGGPGFSNCLRINGTDSQANATAGTLFMKNSVVACEPAENFGDAFAESFFTNETTNSVSTPVSLGLASNGYQPTSGSVLLGSGADPSAVNAFFDSVDYIGAMDANDDWTQGWVSVGLND